VKAVTARAQLLRNEALKVTYSYWDGTGHRRHTTVRKGDTIGAFLSAVREQLSPEFRDLRCARPGSMRPGSAVPGPALTCLEPPLGGACACRLRTPSV